MPKEVLIKHTESFQDLVKQCESAGIDITQGVDVFKQEEGILVRQAEPAPKVERKPYKRIGWIRMGSGEREVGPASFLDWHYVFVVVRKRVLWWLELLKYTLRKGKKK